MTGARAAVARANARSGAQASKAALSASEFAALMAPFAPFETAPQVALGLSGGADSMALALLLRDWLVPRGGSLLALHVDHGLRPGSGREAAWLTRNLAEAGIAVRVLHWWGAKPESAIQEGARQKRYDLLQAACRRAGVLHLALAHHLEDQAETFLMRLARGSGPDGLAAMAVERNLRDLRVIRPLLRVTKGRLTATLEERGQDWIEDPSNQDRRFARVRLRELMPALAQEGLSPQRLECTASELGHLRQARERQGAAFLARHGRLEPEGYVILEDAPWRALDPELQTRVLMRCLLCLGGGAFGPRGGSLETARKRLHSKTFSGLTLGGCRILRRRGGIVICREAGRIEPTAPWVSPHTLWDRRFELSVSAAEGPADGTAGSEAWQVVPLARCGTDWMRETEDVWRRYKALPAAARAALPVLRDGNGLLWAPHLAFKRADFRVLKGAKCRFAPKIPLCPPTFTVV
jgi:tRNA(Ile)-lysidine synthase